uniref:Uncharacterized protein n=1 Tax=Romanomermis culicivorax TaxID=13658 RepID=A0A915JH13_ROMCU
IFIAKQKIEKSYDWQLAKQCVFPTIKIKAYLAATGKKVSDFAGSNPQPHCGLVRLTDPQRVLETEQNAIGTMLRNEREVFVPFGSSSVHIV